MNIEQFARQLAKAYRQGRTNTLMKAQYHPACFWNEKTQSNEARWVRNNEPVEPPDMEKFLTELVQVDIAARKALNECSSHESQM